ncbi:MAG: branched-chain amino acid ABC transporter permease [Chloroflexi bacterium]|nr:branched-chain amino acid ABC transporter permease [Chloroflexota bacterium]
MKRFFERYSMLDIVVFLIGASILALVIIGTFSTLFITRRYDSQQWFDFLVYGVALGGIYAVIAIGYTMVYGILRMINFAHSEVFMSGPLTAYFLADYWGRSGFLDQNPVVGLVVIFAVAMAISMTVAVLLERIAYRPLRFAPRLVPLITAIGASFFLQYFFRGLYGANIKVYPEIAGLKGVVHLGVYSIQYVQILVIVAAAIMMAGLQLFIQRTRTGMAMRAVAEDKQTSALMGIDVDRIIVITFMIGGALAGAAGVLYALMFKQVGFLMGFIPGIKAFTAAVLGGIGNVPGAMVGGLFLGIAESLGPNLFLDGLGIPAPYQLKDAIAFTLLVLVLIFRPTGILGEALAEKKA